MTARDAVKLRRILVEVEQQRALAADHIFAKIELVAAVIGIFHQLPAFRPNAGALRVVEQQKVVVRRREAIGDDAADVAAIEFAVRSEEHKSELKSLMRISYAVFCLTKKKPTH